MDLFKKYFYNTSSFHFDYVKNYLHFVNDKPMSTVLAPITLALLCYYIYVYIRKFYPIWVNCWFCNANFKVAFENRFEFTCIECGQFNGFKEDGSYSKIIPEQHIQRYNKTNFSMNQNNIKVNKNGLCHKCNIIQEMKVKQLASFIPTKEKYFDREIEKYKENIEATSKLCFKCDQYVKKILTLQEQRYSLNSIRMNHQIDIQNISSWPNMCSLCLSFIVFLLSLGAESYFTGDWPIKFVDLSIFHNSGLTIIRSIAIVSLCGTICQVYQCLSTMNKLNSVVMLLWGFLFAINNFETNFIPKLLVSVFIILLSSVSIIINFTKKQKIRQTNIKLEDENNYKLPSTNYYDTSSNESIKNSDESEMMDIDFTGESPKKMKKPHKTVNSMFHGMRLDGNHGAKNNIVKPSRFIMPVKRDKVSGYSESSAGYYSPYTVKDDFDFDTHSIYSQYRPLYSSMCNPTVSPYSYYPSHYHHPSLLNLSHSSNSSNIQQTSEWSKMFIYSIPGMVLFALQCYLLYDIKDFMKQK